MLVLCGLIIFGNFVRQHLIAFYEIDKACIYLYFESSYIYVFLSPVYK